MDMPKNRFKALLKAGKHQLGIWNTIGGNSVAEALAGAGFDWILVDTEHSPVEPVEVLNSLQAIGQYPETSAIVRPVENDTALIKRYLDMGAQNILIPYVQSAAEAEAVVRAARYAPAGVRGVAGMTRATRYGRVPGYHANASDEICLIVQIETRAALDRLEEIATVDGIDAVFIGPADLATSLGYPGDPTHPQVKTVIEDALKRLQKIGVPVGILILEPDYARRCIDLGFAFTGVAVDLVTLVHAADRMVRDFS